jgi:small subunit ribosomal protein S10
MATESKQTLRKKQRNRIRIKLRSYDPANLDLSTKQIVDAAKRTGANISGPIPLPTHIRRYCVLRSPHVDKKSREHFQIATHSRLIDILDPTQETTVALKDLDLAAGVDIAIKV